MRSGSGNSDPRNGDPRNSDVRRSGASAGDQRRSDPRPAGRRASADSGTRRDAPRGDARSTSRTAAPSDRRRVDSRPSGSPQGRSAPAAARGTRPPRAPRPVAPTGGQRPTRAAAPRPSAPRGQTSIRGRRIRRNRAAVGNPRLRSRIALIVLLSMLTLAGGKLVMIQAVDTAGYAAKSEAQRTRTISLLAERGTITDRNGTELAFTVEGRAVAARPALFTDDAQRLAVANILVADVGGGLTADDIMAKLTSGKTYVYLARNLMPAQADAVMDKITPLFDDAHIDAVVTERQDLREYPDGAASAALVGGTDYDGNGLSGVEAKFDTKLSGKDGDRVVDVDARHMIIPGTARDEVAAVNGTDISLTIDSDLQYTAMQMLANRVDMSQALSGCVVVMQVADAQVAAMACYEPGKTPKETGNKAVTDAIEPGSVNKVVTFAAALEQGLVTPTTVLDVDGSIDVADIVVSDAWSHGPTKMTATGILAKSSNVGTLMIAQQVGQDAFVDMSKKFGQGVKTGIQLPAETSGRFPAPSTWSGSTFGNLPIGQGVSMSLLQLAGMYQAIANGGVRIAPTIVASTTVDGQTTPTPLGAATQVVSPATARTLLDMLRGTIQSGDTNHRGTAPQAAITGYQVAGKTGTAQKVDEAIQDYSQTAITSTFAGVVPADNPKYVVAIMLDDPKGNSAAGTTSCAPLFHDIAAYAMRAADVPPSTTQAPVYDLYVS
jgi:cell division protein FtsI (penicillin-binding protein 3)